MHSSFTGANEATFRQKLAEVHKATMSKAGDHQTMTFTQFKPQNKLPICFTATGQVDKMKEFINKLAKENAKDTKVDHLLKWLETFDVKAMDVSTID